jgi:hypothetical protein
MYFLKYNCVEEPEFKSFPDINIANTLHHQQNRRYGLDLMLTKLESNPGTETLRNVKFNNNIALLFTD